MTVTLLIDPCIGSGCQDFKATCHVPGAKKQKEINAGMWQIFFLAHRLMSIVSLQNSLSFY